jgi:hypothetical protein
VASVGDKDVLRGVRRVRRVSISLHFSCCMLQSSKWRAVLGSDVYSHNLRALAIDEAHRF